MGIFAQRREKYHFRFAGANHVAKRMRFAPMFCDGKTGEKPVSGESFPIQDEPEGGGSFQHKMSLERVAC
jgi:hypothetical protein